MHYLARRTAVRATAALGVALWTLPLAAQQPAAPRQAAAPRTDSARAAFTIDDMLELTTVSAADLTADGRWLAATSSTRRDGLGTDFSRDGDPTYVAARLTRVLVIDTKSGDQQPVFPTKRTVRSLAWSPDGTRLAMFLLEGDAFVPVIWTRAGGKLTRVALPAGKYVAENSDLDWTSDGSRLVFSLRTNEWRTQARAAFARLTTGPVIVQTSKDPFLAWDAMRRLSSIRSVVAYDLAAARTVELIPEGKIASYQLAEDGRVVSYAEDITKKTDYDVIGGSENRLMMRTLSAAGAPAASATPAMSGTVAGADTQPRVVFPTTRQLNLSWAADGRRYAYARDGRIYVGTLGDTARKQIAGPTGPARRDSSAVAADTSKEARERAARERFSVVRMSPTGDAVLASNRDGLWLVDVAGGAKSMIVETDSAKGAPRVTLGAWSEDGSKLYFSFASRTKWERGLMRYDRTSKRMEELAKDGRIYSDPRLSKDGRTLVLRVAGGNRPPELYTADVGGTTPFALRRLTTNNPQLASRPAGKTELITYLDADGHNSYGVVYYPTNYQPGTRYPTVFIVYESYFDDTFDPSASLLTANGYVVVKPSVDFDIGYPGEAWVKGVTAAANKLIEMGVTDSARLGVQGQSYGGYATNLLITQTNRFKAAINISGKVDLISFYTDSPRLGVRNIHAAEKSQDRIGATLWQQPQKYVAHSAIMFADRIQTPLLLMTGGQDHNVPADNTREMYYAMRRLGKEVVWANYVNGGHGAATWNAEDFVDFYSRVLRWYDEKLKGAPASREAADGGR